MNRLSAFFRSAATLLLFAVFGIGALPFSFLLAFVPNRGVAQRCVRGIWMPFMKIMSLLGLVSLDCKIPQNIRGAIIVANHPSLLDVLVILVSIPRTFFIAKNSLRNNPFCMMSVRRVSFPDNPQLLEEAPKWLALGWNVVIFPEGTRSPSSRKINKFKRGAAQLALRSNAPVYLFTLNYSRDLLNKRHPFWDVGKNRIICRLRFVEKRETANIKIGSSNFHAAATILIDDFQQIISRSITSLHT